MELCKEADEQEALVCYEQIYCYLLLMGEIGGQEQPFWDQILQRCCDISHSGDLVAEVLAFYIQHDALFANNVGLFKQSLCWLLFGSYYNKIVADEGN